MTLRKKLLVGTGAVLTLLVATALVLPPLLFGDGVDYSHAISIKATPRYQDATLLEKAWSLPTARLYREGLEYQKNPSFCGPTSLVNVAHSLGQRDASQATILDESGVTTHSGMVWGG